MVPYGAHKASDWSETPSRATMTDVAPDGFASPSVAALGLLLTDEGHFQVHHGTDGLDQTAETDAELAPFVEAAFARSELDGLLFLAAYTREREMQASLEFARSLIDLVLERLARWPEAEGIPAPGAIEPTEDELENLVAEAPMMLGFEHVEVEILLRATRRLTRGVLARAEALGSVFAFLQRLGGGWEAVGRLCLNLTERDDVDRPFGFLASFGEAAVPEHEVEATSLAEALVQQRQDRDAVKAILRQVEAAASADPLVARLERHGDLYRPMAWTAAQAYALLQAAPALEDRGVLLRFPPGWVQRRPHRPTVELHLGEAVDFGGKALLDFDVTLALGGERLSPDEQARLLRGMKRLEKVRGKWVEVDPAELETRLSAWRGRDTATLSEAMRLVTGAEETAGVELRTGEGLSALLERLRTASRGKTNAPRSLKATLRPYQKEGLAWLHTVASLGLGGCLADDMGLGKTIQVLALVLRLQAEDRERGPSLLVVPASLLGNWRREMQRFAPSLRLRVAHRSGHEPLADVLAGIEDANVVMTTYGTLPRLEPLYGRHWPLVVLDEAQAIKNHDTLQSRTVRALSSDARVALTGTPVENNLGDLWSLFAFLEPGLLGKQAQFKRLVSKLEEKDDYEPLRKLIRPYVLRREKTDRRIIRDLPDKTEVDVHTPLTHSQAALYEQAVRELAEALGDVDGQERRGLVLSFLTRFKQICNHPSHWLGHTEDFDPSESGKSQALLDIAEKVHEQGEKLLVFTQFRQLTAPLAQLLEPVFGQPGLVLHGGTPVRKRSEMVEAFQAADGPPFFVLSLKAGGTGLNLTAASHVVHFDRWWNPAVENQATDRAFRIGQHRNVLVHRFVCPGTLEEKIAAMLEKKRAVAEQVLAFDGERALTELTDAELLEMVKLDVDAALLEEESS